MPGDSSDQPSDPEDDLPVLAWEDVSRRVRLPDDLREALGLQVTLLRWSSIKYTEVVTKHAIDLPVIEQLEEHLEMWTHAGPQADREDAWTVLFDLGSKTYLVSIGRDRSGSHNLVTVFGTNDPGYVARRRQQLKMRRSG